MQQKNITQQIPIGNTTCSKQLSQILNIFVVFRERRVITRFAIKAT
jgi:hypothetical protein